MKMPNTNNHGGARTGAGRPVKDEKRDKSIHIRVSQKELDLISECSEKMNTTRANVIVKAVEELNQKLKSNHNQ